MSIDPHEGPIVPHTNVKTVKVADLDPNDPTTPLFQLTIVRRDDGDYQAEITSGPLDDLVAFAHLTGIAAVLASQHGMVALVHLLTAASSSAREVAVDRGVW